MQGKWISPHLCVPSLIYKRGEYGEGHGSGRLDTPRQVGELDDRDLKLFDMLNRA
jgi:hypothetical protein